MAKKNTDYSSSLDISIEDIIAEYKGGPDSGSEDIFSMPEPDDLSQDFFLEQQDIPDIQEPEQNPFSTEEIHDDAMEFFEKFTYANPVSEEPSPDIPLHASDMEYVSEEGENSTEKQELFPDEEEKTEWNSYDPDSFFQFEEEESPFYDDSAEAKPAFRQKLLEFVEKADHLLSGIFGLIAKQIEETREKWVLRREQIEEAEQESAREPEPPLREEAMRFASGNKYLRIRSFAAFCLSSILLFFTVWYEFSGRFPFGIGNNLILLSGIGAIIQLFVMALAIDVLLDGLFDILRGRPGMESLALVSSLLVLAFVFYQVCTGNSDFGLPYSLVSCFSLSYAIRGKRLYRSAMSSSLSVAASSSVRYGIISDSGTIEDRSVLKKVNGKISGFYYNIVSADFSEILYSYAAPILFLFALVFSLISSTGNSFGHFLFSFSAMLAIGTTFTGFTAFSLPFENAVRKTKDTGGTVAGWGGAAMIHDSDGSIITDDDVFPIGTVSLHDYTLMEGMDNKVICYTSSLVIASDSGLSKVFSELLHGMGLSMEAVERFACYEGGMGATIRTDQVLVGTAGFMNLMSVRIPGTFETKNSIFTAINGELAAQFSLNYEPANSVQSALISLLKTRAPMVFAVRDFNVTPAVIRQKYKVPIEDIEYIPSKDCYRLSDDSDAELYDTSAVILREGLGPFADIIRRGRQTYTLTLLTSVISAVTAYIGILLIFILTGKGAYYSASAFNTFLYLSAMHIPMMGLARWIAMRK